MASPDGLVPISFRGLFWSFYVCIGILFCLGVYRAVDWQNSQVQDGLHAGLDTIVRHRLEALTSENYRHFVEGLGSQMGSLFVQIENDQRTFYSGQKPAIGATCVSREIAAHRVKLCQRFGLPWKELLFMVMYLFGSILLFRRLVLFLEQQGILDLGRRYGEKGLQIDPASGVQGLIEGTSELAESLKRQLIREHSMEGEIRLAENAAKAAHDIRSPLSALAVLSQYEGVPAEAKDLLKAAVERIQGIAEGFLRQARQIQSPGECSSGDFEARSHDVGTLLEELVREMRIVWSSHRIEFIRPNPHAVAPVFFNPSELLRAVGNLINNAAEASLSGGEVLVGIEQDQNQLRISVKDTGKGIPSDLLPFLGEKGRTHDKEHGSGFGLYQVRSFLREIGGYWQIDSSIGLGTKFVLTVPKHPGNASSR